MDGGELNREELQRLLRGLVSAYARLKREDSALTPFGSDRTVTATEVATLAVDMLDAVGMDTFELQVWRSFGQP